MKISWIPGDLVCFVHPHINTFFSLRAFKSKTSKTTFISIISFKTANETGKRQDHSVYLLSGWLVCFWEGDGWIDGWTDTQEQRILVRKPSPDAATHTQSVQSRSNYGLRTSFCERVDCKEAGSNFKIKINEDLLFFTLIFCLLSVLKSGNLLLVSK